MSGYRVDEQARAGPMSMIARTFFITAMGRSGTSFLARTLDQSAQYKVVHEWRIRGTPYQDARLRRFPLHRFWLARWPFPQWRPGYGEVNSYLRLALSHERAGPEARIEKRGVLLRDPREILSSVMNRGGRQERDFPASCEDVLYWCDHLMQLVRHPRLHYEPFYFDRMTNDPAYVLDIARWAGIEDLPAHSITVDRTVNENLQSWFPSWDGWLPEHRNLFEQTADKFGIDVEDYLG